MITDAGLETAMAVAWSLACVVSAAGVVGLLFRNQIVRLWQRARHIPTYIANHRLIREPAVTETDYEGRHRWHTGLTGMFPVVPQLPVDPRTVIVDGELVDVSAEPALVGA